MRPIFWVRAIIWVGGNILGQEQKIRLGKKFWVEGMGNILCQGQYLGSGQHFKSYATIWIGSDVSVHAQYFGSGSGRVSQTHSTVDEYV